MHIAYVYCVCVCILNFVSVTWHGTESSRTREIKTGACSVHGKSRQTFKPLLLLIFILFIISSVRTRAQQEFHIAYLVCYRMHFAAVVVAAAAADCTYASIGACNPTVKRIYWIYYSMTQQLIYNKFSPIENETGKHFLK